MKLLQHPRDRRSRCAELVRFVATCRISRTALSTWQTLQPCPVVRSSSDLRTIAIGASHVEPRASVRVLCVPHCSSPGELGWDLPCGASKAPARFGQPGDLVRQISGLACHCRWWRLQLDTTRIQVLSFEAGSLAPGLLFNGRPPSSSPLVTRKKYCRREKCPASACFYFDGIRSNGGCSLLGRRVLDPITARTSPPAPRMAADARNKAWKRGEGRAMPKTSLTS